MPCHHPLHATYTLRADGKKNIKFSNFLAQAFIDGRELYMPFENRQMLPCGRCTGCRLEYSRQWAVRCMHEAQFFENNCFITLTFDNDHVPFDFSLDVKYFQDFMKRLRERFGSGVRYFHCGEYGAHCKVCGVAQHRCTCAKFVPQLGRPHFHACLFNFDFVDRTLWSVVNGQRLYVSEALQDLWSFGFSTVGTVTFQSAAYVARYATKKITGDMADEHYSLVSPVDGKVYRRKPEYATMSRVPGLGSDWFDKYWKSDIYDNGYLIVNGIKCKPPRYYDEKLKVLDPVLYEKVKSDRLANSLTRDHDNSYQRLLDREVCLQSKLRQLIRTL